jgi:hypothetical protein
MELFPSAILARNAATDFGTPGKLSQRNFCAKNGANGRGERGAGHLKAIVWTLILASLIYVAVKVIPILVNEYEFRDGLQTIAQFASVNRQPNDKLRDSILKEAQKDDVPIQSEDIKVEGAGGNVRINIDYSVTVDLGVYKWTLNFNPSVSNNALF